MESLIAEQLWLDLFYWEVMMVSLILIKEAIDCGVTHTLSFWDALIVVTTDYAHCAELVVELSQRFLL